MHKPRPGPAAPSVDIEAEVKSHTVDLLNDTPRQMILGERQMILGDKLIGFYIVPNKTKSSAYGGRGFSIYCDIDPDDIAVDLKEKMNEFIDIKI
jgi:hypothetical protein